MGKAKEKMAALEKQYKLVDRAWNVRLGIDPPEGMRSTPEEEEKTEKEDGLAAVFSTRATTAKDARELLAALSDQGVESEDDIPPMYKDQFLRLLDLVEGGSGYIGDGATAGREIPVE